ncbi:DUF1365 domain-containing protein [Kitasatospora sp. NBC_01287]|uniref:DUF1365 domain-containing protein n=1 Tax=Kitasatospora sp. NBC_01287 TaxID=2903573 RepID=UPI0022518D2A|nr:DUF1365 domain-containing protein [Kitasatospora sp. NBC_01287]MCX4751635.1 DUF1365 domain-containing protein [Kitasatospora sp. NBC_01287]
MSGALPGPWGAALYDCRIGHLRTAPLRHAFQHRTYLWLVDPDRLPPVPGWLRPLAAFHAADHPGPAGLTIRQKLEHYLAEQGVEAACGRILMLTQARSYGYVFNPLTVYWCHDREGRPLCTVAEVRNTYGGAHRYLLRPDERGRATTAKEFYVSPFFPVDGEYHMVLPEPGERLALAIRLERPGGPAFTATVRGTRRPAGPGQLLLAALRHPFATPAVPLHIRYQGIRLLLRGLPVQPRPGGGCPVAGGRSAGAGPVGAAHPDPSQESTSQEEALLP